MVKVVTINILYDQEEWEQRRTLLVDGLAREQADLIALQEVKLPENTASELAIQLGMPYLQKVLRQTLLDLVFNRTLRPWRDTLDYIFVNQHIHVQDCQLILNKPASGSSTLYPSDHFGIASVLEIVN